MLVFFQQISELQNETLNSSSLFLFSCPPVYRARRKYRTDQMKPKNKKSQLQFFFCINACLSTKQRRQDKF